MQGLRISMTERWTDSNAATEPKAGSTRRDKCNGTARKPKPDSEVKSKWQAMTTPHRFQSICISSRCVECDLPEQDTIHLVHPVDGETDDICGGGEWRPIATAPIGKRILIATPLADQSVYVLEASFCDGSWRAWRDWSTVCDPTHWMPMPEPPKA